MVSYSETSSTDESGIKNIKLDINSIENNVKDSEENDETIKKIYYTNLSPMEQEKLTQELISQIMNSRTIFDNTCCLFCRWAQLSFYPNAEQPAPFILSEFLEYIENNFEETEELEADRLFWEGGNVDKIQEYYDNIVEDQHIDFANVEIYSLAIACRKYIRDKITFVNQKLYNQIIKLYQDGESEFVIERLPFIIHHRAMTKYILNIAHKENRITYYEDWGDVIFKNTEYRVLNGEIVRKLSSIEFNLILDKFYK